MISKFAILLCLSMLIASCGRTPEPQASASLPPVASAPASSPTVAPTPLTSPTPPTARTNKITVELNDPTSNNNPIRSFSGDKMTIAQMVAKLGRLNSNQDVALICEGAYNPKSGILAFDVMHGNQLKPAFMPKSDMTLDAVCWKQAKVFANGQRF